LFSQKEFLIGVIFIGFISFLHRLWFDLFNMQHVTTLFSGDLSVVFVFDGCFVFIFVNRALKWLKN
jgi:hypothetical protein